MWRHSGVVVSALSYQPEGRSLSVLHFALHFPCPCLVRYGPPKSTPIRSNAHKEGVTLDLGTGAII